MSRRASLPTEERRNLALADAGVQLRADEDKPPRFTGHAAVFNSRTAIGPVPGWGFLEEIAPGAFTKTLKEGDARMLIDHESSKVVSRVSAGTLDLAEDDAGLATNSALDDELSYVRDLTANLRNGNVTGMSFGFRVVKDDWLTEELDVEGLDDPAEVEVRVIREVKLIEVSAVTFPAYTETDAGLRFGVMPALARRGDREAISRRTADRPELQELLPHLPVGEPRRRTLSLAEMDRLADAYALSVERKPA
ncbi:HK97 family phage prohead protease [Actinomadura alba]|nr:HK97 family phage prohead protease [Actinomadura alba]